MAGGPDRHLGRGSPPAPPVGVRALLLGYTRRPLRGDAARGGRGAPPGADAKDQIQKLTDDQTNYFAGNPERIQLVGQENWGGQSDNLWWEWVFGILALAAAGAIILIAVNNNN